MLDDKDLTFIRSLIQRAGRLARRIQKGSIEIKRKSDSTFVTQADILLQNMIIDGIKKKFRSLDVKFISEENFDGSTIDIGPETLTFIIDPIDGTAVYTMGLPTWSVSLGIFEGFIPKYGFVCSPASDLFFHSDDDRAYLNGRTVSARLDFEIDSETNIFFASGLEREYKFDFPGKIRNIGSTALHASLCADNGRNRTLAFFGNRASLWDWAGSIPIILKSGGNLRYINGGEIDYRKVFENRCVFLEHLVAYNAESFSAVQKIFVKR